MVDSPLQLVSYNYNNSKNDAQQAFRIYYQSVNAEIRELQSNGGSSPSWLPVK